MVLSWRDVALAAMADAIRGRPPEEWEKAIDAAYPFGQRRYWPYKVWLKARKEFLKAARRAYGCRQEVLFETGGSDRGIRQG